jgi:two-component system sensor histidine kinase BarA
MGDASGPAVLERRLADALLRRPVAPSEWAEALARLVSGAPFADPAAAAPAAEALPQFEGARVLVADDSEVNREVACEALSRLGIRAETVEDGSQAIEAVATGRFDLVLMDGSMPVVDGFEAARRIRAAEAEGAPRTAIVALTAHVIGDGAEAWREAGMDGVLHKPFTLKAMADCLAAHLTPGWVDRATPAADLPAVPVATEAPLLDPGVIAGLEEMAVAAGPGFLHRIVGLYRGHAPGGAAALRAALAGGDAADVARAAHGLKSMSLNVGAARLAALLGAIEGAARGEGRLPDGADCARVEMVLGQTLEAIAERFPAAEDGAAALAS